MTDKTEKDDTSATKDEKEAVEFPEFDAVKPEEIAAMSHEAKLKLIEKEAQTLYDFCLQKGLSKKDLSWCLKPLFGSPPEYVKKVVKDNSKFCLSIGLIFGLVAVIVAWSPAYNFCCIHGKLALMKVLPYWDWTYIYDQDCLLKNPYVAPPPNMTKEECGACIDMQKNGVEALSNASLDVITNDFLLVDFPGIIEDGTKGWPKPKFGIKTLNEEYTNHKDLDSVGDCRFNSSDNTITSVYDFFGYLDDGKITGNYYAMWDNCDLKAAKHFRLYYKRPYYLPPMAEASKTSTFLVAKGKMEDPVPFVYEEEASGLWLTVIKGQLQVELVPVEGCANFKGCSSINTDLKAGEAILIPLRIWQVDVLAQSDGETVALGSTVTWDESQGEPPEDGRDEKPIGGKSKQGKAPKSEEE